LQSSALAPFEVTGCKITTKAYEASSMSPPVLLERHIDV
jgi:hypothetical protein